MTLPNHHVESLRHGMASGRARERAGRRKRRRPGPRRRPTSCGRPGRRRPNPLGGTAGLIVRRVSQARDGRLMPTPSAAGQAPRAGRADSAYGDLTSAWRPTRGPVKSRGVYSTRGGSEKEAFEHRTSAAAPLTARRAYGLSQNGLRRRLEGPLPVSRQSAVVIVPPRRDAGATSDFGRTRITGNDVSRYHAG
jgi:hypothetical protein